MNFKNLSLDLESAPPPIYYLWQFSVKMDNFKYFGLNLGKLSNYVCYFGSSDNRCGWRWMEVGGGGCMV